MNYTESVTVSTNSARTGKAVLMVKTGGDIIEVMLAVDWSSEVMLARDTKQAKLAMGGGAKLSK